MSKDKYLAVSEFDSSMVKLFKYLDKQFAAVHTDFDDLRGEFRELQSAVDAYAKQVEIYHHESIARDAHVDRLQRWIEQIAKKTGIKLEY